ncbi:hypothetical protein GGR33_004303 [Methylobacterium brachythecii]|uniref:Uncharacterized protein n=1 Tax=Methylobacterium brachythecii TaxID=1176177 RepID=A0A7W6AJX9_9HYPH|nr:hypothetical protein [Methylobacterium brachythecii]
MLASAPLSVAYGELTYASDLTSRLRATMVGRHILRTP